MSELKKKKVLVIDDSQTIQDLIKKILSKAPEIEVIQSLDAKSAIQEIATTPDLALILMDITMPEISGLDLLKIINKSMIERKFKICMLSARNTLEHISTSIALGCDDYIIKPFDNERFLNKVKYFTGSSSDEEISTTYMKKLYLHASVADMAFEIPIIVSAVTEYDLHFISPIKVKKNSILKIAFPTSDSIFENKDSVDLMIKSQETEDGKHLVIARIINLSYNEEKELRSFVIKD